MASSEPRPVVNNEHAIIEAAIKLFLISILLVWCFQIIRPFLVPVIWATLLAVALYPMHLGLTARLGGKAKLSATLITLAGLALLLIPTFSLGGGVVDSAGRFTEHLQAGTLEIPPPTDQVKSWPLIGEKAHATWLEASQNLTGFMVKHKDSIGNALSGLLGMLGSLFGGVAMFCLSVIIGGVFLTTGEACKGAVQQVADRVTGHTNSELPQLACDTIRSVAKGVLGVAVIQALAAGLGMVLVGVPAAGVWMVLVLVLAIAQLPPIIVLAPIIAYVFSVNDGMSATLFAVWSLIVSGSDGFLKPMFLGRGMEVPMLVILLGAIGGMMLSGIIGLFAGAVVLAVGYTLFMAWLSPATQDAEQGAQDEHSGQQTV
ncbi:AI-2E family transporter [Ferrimonas marina]|uniref:Predicted PurR-regulated permease PerM n=1 Tax=Ferrimonas marina TaxID=299255 RepID=A0A1M5VA77_9GAMM|nr:AI-2E family transporter [Ferrimonas marina]SHH72127.1 Predicted PurR-regulated permease PerM [Ferrimonas marina]